MKRGVGLNKPPGNILKHGRGNTMKKQRIDLTYEHSTLNNPIDMHLEMKRKNYRLQGKDKSTASTASDPLSIMADLNGSESKVLIADDSRSLGLEARTAGTSSNALSLDWTQWLPFASKVYNISPNIKDYIIVPVLTIPSDLPNRNGVGFPLKELVRFNPELGMQCYKTWKGKPCFEEHANDDHKAAKGVILDTHMKPMKKYGIWRLLKLLAYDRTRDPQLCNDILARKRNSYSMGAYLSGYTCSYCHKPFGTCEHIPYGATPQDMIFLPYKDSLIFKNVVMPEGFETSSVKTPAFITALNDEVIDMGVIDTKTQLSDMVQLANINGHARNSTKK